MDSYIPLHFCTKTSRYYCSYWPLWNSSLQIRESIIHKYYFADSYPKGEISLSSMDTHDGFLYSFAFLHQNISLLLFVLASMKLLAPDKRKYHSQILFCWLLHKNVRWFVVLRHFQHYLSYNQMISDNERPYAMKRCKGLSWAEICLQRDSNTGPCDKAEITKHLAIRTRLQKRMLWVFICFCEEIRKLSVFFDWNEKPYLKLLR